MSLVERVSQSDGEITSCIDRGLDRVGPHVKYLVYWHLQNISHLKKTDITANPENFAIALTTLFKESSAGVERAIVQELNVSFGLSFTPSQLVKAIIEARRRQSAARQLPKN